MNGNVEPAQVIGSEGLRHTHSQHRRSETRHELCANYYSSNQTRIATKPHQRRNLASIRYDAVWSTMEKMQHAEELVREFLVFRGFTNTLESYEAELRTDIGKGFEVDKILDLIFSLYVPKFHADSLLALLAFFKHYLSSSSDAPLASTLSKLETSLLRFYVVHAVQCNRNDKVVDFFTLYGAELLQRSQDWTNWFGAFCFSHRRFCFLTGSVTRLD